MGGLTTVRMKTVRGDQARGAYNAIAPVYDDFTADHDYELWIGNIWPAIAVHGLHGRRLLDVGCGTGKSFIPLLEKGWEVTACDVSAAMIEVARDKVGDEARLAVADMRELPVFGEFDLVWCMGDAVNYLLSAEELAQALAAMGRNLASQGLLVFDLDTLATYRSFFTEEVTVERGGKRMTWHGLGSPDQPPSTIFEARLETEHLEARAGPAPSPSIHRLRHFTEAEVLAALEAGGLECLAAFGHEDAVIPEQPLDETRHRRAIYVARAARGGGP
ncbi:MAG TPA: class I SAM-dependent methyltransferase [Solirubrobacterales bacterium]|nr:class I SAM-dependent methyltransferase [Solirubrobacterales bacterium]